MNALVEFLGARVDEDFEAVRRVIGVNVMAAVQDGVPVPRWVPSPKNEAGVWDTNRQPRVKFAWPRERDHIIRHDPARVLAEIEAKRALVDEFERCGPNTEGYSGLRFAVAVIATVYADHPDYREEWKP